MQGSSTRLLRRSRERSVGETPLWEGTQEIFVQALPIRVVRGEPAKVEARDVGVGAFRFPANPDAVREEILTQGVRSEMFEHVRQHAVRWAANLT